MSQQVTAAVAPGSRRVASQPTRGGAALARTLLANTSRWYALVILVCLVLIAITLLVLTQVLPDGADVDGSVRFYAEHRTLLKGVSAGLALLFLVGTFWSAAFLSRLWEVDTSKNRVLSWSAILSEIFVFGLFFVEAGIFAATVLLSGNTTPEIIHALHVVVLVSAAILGPVWIPFALCALLISKRTGLFPSWLNAICVVVIMIDICTLTGVFTLTGPVNGENGLIGAFSGVLGPIVCVGAVIAWEAVDWAQAKLSEVGEPV